jgi:hypothetical protein
MSLKVNIKNIIVSFTIFCISCTNPFAVREPEPPSPTENSDTYERPTRSETVLLNLRFALIQENIGNYEKCFVDANNSTNFTYRFLHDQRIESGLLMDWSLIDEIQYLSNIINGDSLRSINLNYLDSLSYKSISTFPDSVWTSFDYELVVSFTDSSYLYKGQSIIKLVKDMNSLWSIYYWEDRPSGDNYSNSWSFLKMKFR